MAAYAAGSQGQEEKTGARGRAGAHKNRRVQRAAAESDEMRLIARVARMYHLDDIKQSDIAQQLRISQAGISRLLRRARDEGIVRISVGAPAGTCPEIEDRLRRRFGIAEIVVAECSE